MIQINRDALLKYLVQFALQLLLKKGVNIYKIIAIGQANVYNIVQTSTLTHVNKYTQNINV